MCVDPNLVFSSQSQTKEVFVPNYRKYLGEIRLHTYVYCCTGCNIGNENKESLKLVFLSPCLATLLDVDDKPAKNALDNFFVR